jgi:hypothetical protein
MADLVCAQNFFYAKWDKTDFASHCLDFLFPCAEGEQAWAYQLTDFSLISFIDFFTSNSRALATL